MKEPSSETNAHANPGLSNLVEGFRYPVVEYPIEVRQR
jgi:hypothetical protein